MTLHKKVWKDHANEAGQIPWPLGTNNNATYSQYRKKQVHPKAQKGLEQDEPQNQWKAVKT